MFLLIHRKIDVFDTKAAHLCHDFVNPTQHWHLRHQSNLFSSPGGGPQRFASWFSHMIYLCYISIYIYIYIYHIHMWPIHMIYVYIYINTWKFTYTTYVNTIYIRRPLEHEGIIRRVLSFTQPKSSFSSSLHVDLALCAIPSCSSSHSLTATCSSCT